MSSEFGNKIKISVFGQSHGEAIGVVINGLPSGEAIDFDELQAFMERRRGGKNAFSTKRSEADIPEFVSGIANGKTCGMPLCAIIRNGDKRSSDYSELLDKPRPGHADYTAFVKWSGNADMRGGGHFSGRLTAPLCIAGGIAKQILARRGIYVGAHLDSVAGIRDKRFEMTDGKAIFEEIAAKDFPVINDIKGEEMKAAIISAAGELDSVGGVIECGITGAPVGIGAPFFGSVESRISSMMFSIPAIKGIEFGAGFGFAKMTGKDANDEFYTEDGKIKTYTNNNAGINGGITNGMPVVFRTVVKPTPSISQSQKTVDIKKMENTEVVVKGRHDPCIVGRAVPVIEAGAAIAILDMLKVK